jgi:hypothetical protein
MSSWTLSIFFFGFAFGRENADRLQTIIPNITTRPVH